MLDAAFDKKASSIHDGASAQNAFVWIAIVCGAVIIAYVASVLIIFAEYRIGMLVGAGAGVCCLGVGVWARISGGLVWPVRLLLMVMIICVTFVAFINGGADGYVAPCLIVVPLIAGYFLGAKSSLAFGALTGLCAIGLYVADVNGLVIESPFSTGAVRLLALLIIIVCISMALVASSFFARSVSRRANQMEESRVLLARMAEVAEIGGWELDIKTMHLVWTEQTRIIHEVDECFAPTPENAAAFFAPEGQATIANAVEQCIQSGQAFDFELPLTTAKGRRLWVRAAGGRMNENGVPAKLIGVFQDITERATHAKELEARRLEAESASIAKSQFLATMSHEIRTPMNGVMGMLELLLRGNLGAQQERHALIAQESAQNLMRIINDVLDFSKIEAGQVELESIAFNTSDLIRHAVSLMAMRADEKGLALSSQTDEDVPIWLAGDPTRITQVLLNLIGNAVKFTDEGGVTVRAIYVRDAGGDHLKISVTDTGIGISSDDQAKLFERFMQADSTTTRKFGGSGLGLAISKQLIELMGGDVGVESAPGLGATFWFTFPARQTQAIEKRVVDEPVDAPPEQPNRPLNILVAEDNAVNQMIVQTFLKMEGHAVVIANNGSEAVEAVQAQAFDIVLMDIQMPVMDGVAATQAIRALPGPAKDIAIIAVTADAMDCDRDKYLACGMNEYLSKPVQSAALFEAIGRILAGDDHQEIAKPAPRSDAQSAQG